MADGSIVIDTQIDTTGASKGIDKLTQKIDKLADNKTLTSVAKLGASVTGLQSAFSMVTGAVSKVNAAIKETTELYKKQVKAETQLSTAVKNNPMLDSSSVAKLKDYASQLQSISTTGDEELLPLMAQLASAGRTEQEIMDIMSASLDIAASGSMSLESAVRNLNKTFGGYSGELGETNPQIKALTEEELKNGDAVKIMAAQYKGMAEQTAKITGSADQLKNAWGDLKEALGKPIQGLLTPIQNGFTKLISNVTSKINELEDRANKIGGASAPSGSTPKETLQYEIDQLKEIIDLYDNASNSDAIIKKNQGIIDNQNNQLNLIKRARENNQKEFEDAKYLAEGQGPGQGQKEYNEALEKYNKNNALYNQREAEAKQKIKDAEQAIYEANAGQELAEGRLLDLGYEDINQGKAALANKQTELATMEKQEKAEQDRLTASQKQKKAQEEAEAKAQKELDVINSVKDSVNSQVKALQIKADLEGKEVDNADLLEVYTNGYVDLLTQSGGIIKEDNNYAKELLGNIEALSDVDAPAIADTEWMKQIESYDPLSGVKEELKQIDELMEEAVNNGYDKSNEGYKQMIKKREELLDELANYEKQKTLETWQSVLSTMSEFVSAATQIASSMSDIITTEAEARKDKQEAILEEQYDSQLISEEEYNAKKEEIEKEYAQQEYKAQMWEWTASLAQIGVSTAQAVVNALNTKPAAVGIALAATMSALGAAQLAAAVASKPVPPSYATGGVIGGFNGASLGGDNTYAHVRNGEMILNAKQQKALWAVANNGSGSSGSNITVKNYRGSDTSVNSQITEDGIKLIIRKSVSEGMKNGDFNSDLRAANSTMNGIRYIS